MPVSQNKIWKFLASVKLTIWLLSFIAILSAIGTFIPQNEDAAVYIDAYGRLGYEVLSKTGLNHVYSAWWFILFLILFSLNLAVCLLSRFSLKRLSLGSSIAHLSVLVILLGALMGIVYGQKGFIQIMEGQEVSVFQNQRSETVNLGFTIRLDDFIYSQHVDPKEGILVYPCQDGDTCSIENPIAKIPADIATESEIPGTGFKVKVLSYQPDFIMDTATKQASSRSNLPKNPAVELELKDESGKFKTFWVFAHFPDMHRAKDAKFRFVYNWAERRPKDFISKVTILKGSKVVLAQDIRVNKPLSFGGYHFFQSSYDKDKLKWSGLQVAKDPGVPVVYAGFVMLMAGLMVIFYVNPLIRSTPR